MFHTINCAARNLPLPPYAVAGIRTHISRVAPSIRNLYSGYYSTSKATVAELIKLPKTKGTYCEEMLHFQVILSEVIVDKRTMSLRPRC